jgi:hypothetical protein
LAIYVDQIQKHKSGLWCHMATDGDLEELHKMAVAIGLKRDWFQDHQRVPHYDLRPSKRALAIKHGAQQIGTLAMVKKCGK